MALPKKGSRKIVVDEVEYRWSIRRKPTYSQAAFDCDMTAAVELAASPGAALLITFPWARSDNWVGSKASPITPKHIEACITAALKEGWKPQSEGGAFGHVYKE